MATVSTATTSATSSLYLPSMTESGMVTGLDTDSIITKLMSLAREPEVLLQNTSADDQAKSAVIGTVLSKLSTLDSVVQQFQDASLPFFSQSTATSTDDTVVQGTVTGSQPTQGTYQINITQVATAAIVNSGELYIGADLTAQGAEFASAAGINASGQTVDATQSLSSQNLNLGTTAAATGTISINGTAIAWDNSQSLNTILGNINNAGLGVTASWDAVNQKISLISNNTGSATQITLSETNGNLLEAFNLTAGTATGTDAANTNAGVALNSANVNLDRPVTSGTFTLNGVVFNVDASKDTLDDVLNRINNSSAGVTATFNPATEGITLIQKNTGSANKIVLGASGDTSNLLYALQLSNNNPPQGGQADTISGTDTKLSFNGGAVQSFGSNQITSLIPGVTVSAEGLGTAQLTIGADVNSMVSTIQNFVTDYNDLMDFITSKITESSGDTTDSSGNTIAASDSTDPTVRIQGTFNGDENFSETKDKLTSIVSSVVSGLSSTMNQLAQIGITTSSDNDGETGDLVLNVSQLTTALTNNSAGVAALFNTSGTGIMSQIHNEITALSDSATGAFTTEQNMFNTENADLDQQVSDMENTMVQKEAAYRQEFADLEQLASSYTSIGNNISKLLGVSAS